MILRHELGPLARGLLLMRSRHRVALLDANANSEKPAKFREARPDIFTTIAFAPDGKAAYSAVKNGIGNLWLQPYCA
jgi:hypothetical protein